jgi:hypothetical protein
MGVVPWVGPLVVERSASGTSMFRGAPVLEVIDHFQGDTVEGDRSHRNHPRHAPLPEHVPE